MLGHHWFDADTLRFFKSRFGDVVFGGRFFITSEQPPNGDRRWSIRETAANGSIGTVGDFMAYDNYVQARRAAERLAEEGAA